MNVVTRCICLLVLSVTGSAALNAGPLSDEQVRELVVQQSLRSYPGNCPCPYNVDRGGRRCGGRSAWSRAGGYSPLCFTREVTEEQVRQYRARNGV